MIGDRETLVFVEYSYPYRGTREVPTGAWEEAGPVWRRRLQRAAFRVARWLGARERKDRIETRTLRVDPQDARRTLDLQGLWERLRELQGDGHEPVAVLCGREQYMRFVDGYEHLTRPLAFDLDDVGEFYGGLRVIRRCGVRVICVPWMYGCLPMTLPVYLGKEGERR